MSAVGRLATGRVRQTAVGILHRNRRPVLDESEAVRDWVVMSSRSIWIRRGLVLFSAAVVLRAIAERRPEKLPMLALTAAIFVTVVVVGWLYSTRRER